MEEEGTRSRPTEVEARSTTGHLLERGRHTAASRAAARRGVQLGSRVRHRRACCVRSPGPVAGDLLQRGLGPAASRVPTGEHVEATTSAAPTRPAASRSVAHGTGRRPSAHGEQDARPPLTTRTTRRRRMPIRAEVEVADRPAVAPSIRSVAAQSVVSSIAQRLLQEAGSVVVDERRLRRSGMGRGRECSGRARRESVQRRHLPYPGCSVGARGEDH